MTYLFAINFSSTGEIQIPDPGLISFVVKKMNTETNLLAKYVNFVDNTKKQNKNF